MYGYAMESRFVYMENLATYQTSVPGAYGWDKSCKD